ncbi:MAG: hypothetical protein ACYCV0_02715 [Desulfitobacteriaceae bacterium]
MIKSLLPFLNVLAIIKYERDSCSGYRDFACTECPYLSPQDVKRYVGKEDTVSI